MAEKIINYGRKNVQDEEENLQFQQYDNNEDVNIA